jgi:hypothetical protein
MRVWCFASIVDSLGTEQPNQRHETLHLG